MNDLANLLPLTDANNGLISIDGLGGDSTIRKSYNAESRIEVERRRFQSRNSRDKL